MKRMFLPVLAASIAGGLLCLGTAAQASENSDLLDTLHANHTITDAQYEALKKKEAADAKAWSAWHLPKIDGYIQFDAPLSVGSANVLGSQTNLRRFYVHIHDTIAPGWSYTTTFGYFNGATYVATGYFSYSGFKHVTLSTGYMKEPFSVSYLTSPPDLLFPERPLPVMALDPSKNIGAQVAVHGARWNVTGGIFGGAYDKTATPGVEGRWGESVRATYTPVLGDGLLWEVGGSFAWREADSSHSTSFGYRPESFTVGAQLAKTPSITGITWFSTTGAETYAQAGPWSLQGEFLTTHVNRDNKPSLTLPGWYVQTAWSLTGEQRRFNPSTGIVGGLVPKHTLSSGGWGAMELAAQYSALDLNSADISGGFERNVSVGLNWYPEKPLKFMLDAIRILPLRGGSYNHQSSTIVMARLQAAY